jgi:putative ABC transport system ATP-binding protein
MALMELERLTRTYRKGSQEVQALKALDLKVEKGEFVAIMGHSGSGKSTLMHVLGCMDRPDSGSYRLEGQEVAGLNDNQLSDLRNRKIGFVFQDFNLLPRYTALQNVALPLVYAGKSRGKEAQALQALERVGLGRRADHLPSELSGGEQQRVAIARALVTGPQVLMADEPTGNLDTAVSNQIMGLFEGLNAEGISILMVTHEPDIAAYCRRMIVLKDGLLVSDQPIQPRVAS